MEKEKIIRPTIKKQTADKMKEYIIKEHNKPEWIVNELGRKGSTYGNTIDDTIILLINDIEYYKNKYNELQKHWNEYYKKQRKEVE